MNGDMIHDDTERDRCGDASVRSYHALAQRYQYSVVHAMAPDLYWVRNDVLTSSVGLDAYDTTNDAEAHVKAGLFFESTGCLRVWQTRGYMKSTRSMSSEFISVKRLLPAIYGFGLYSKLK